MLAQATIERIPIKDNSIDLIFTDPPYQKQSLPCYGWLASEAMRVLKQGGFILAMCGGMYLNQIYRMFDDAGLTYFYEMFHYGIGKDRPVIWPRGVVAAGKPIIVYSKGKVTPIHWNVINVFQASRFGKEFHHWGQDVESARYYVDCFSHPDDLVLDPFVGGGTTLVACALIGRRYIGMDNDPVALATTQKRLSESDVHEQALMF